MPYELIVGYLGVGQARALLGRKEGAKQARRVAKTRQPARKASLKILGTVPPDEVEERKQKRVIVSPTP
jgi:hypothetical protein